MEESFLHAGSGDFIFQIAKFKCWDGIRIEMLVHKN